MNTIPQKEKRTLKDTDFEVDQLASDAGGLQTKTTAIDYIKFLVMGTFFGILLVKAEIISWYRIQEMFRFQSFHMYGVMGSAVAVGALSVFLIKKFKVTTISGEPIVLRPKQFNKGQIWGSLLFGFGWAITGACPGPLFAQIGSGFTVIVVTLFSAIAGTWVYGRIRESLPH